MSKSVWLCVIFVEKITKSCTCSTTVLVVVVVVPQVHVLFACNDDGKKYQKISAEAPIFTTIFERLYQCTKVVLSVFVLLSCCSCKKIFTTVGRL